MDHAYWHQLWQDGRINFHQADGNARLVQHFLRLGLAESSTVFVPLCGKTRDIAWLLDQGMRVVGCELSQTAVEHLFEDLGAQPDVTELPQAQRFSAPAIDVYVGDIFDLTQTMLGPIDAVYDRAALVALPPAMRTAYTAHLCKITQTAKQLLLAFEYDQTQMDGPPFNVAGPEVEQHYAANYDLLELDRLSLPGGLKSANPAFEIAWLLSPRST